jgi:hypothetical protein
VFLQLIQSEVRGKVEAQELSSEEDDDVVDERNVSGTESSGSGSSNSYDGEDGGDDASSNRGTNSPKVNIVS